MPKDTPDALPAPATPPVNPPEKLPLFPGWFWIAALILIVLGGALIFTAEGRQRAAALAAFNNAKIEVRIQDKEMPEEAAVVYFENPTREYLNVLGACSSDSKFAISIFNELLKSKDSTKNGKSLALLMSLYLSHDGHMSNDEFNLVVQHLDTAQTPEVRAVAQTVLSVLVASTDLSRKKELEDLPPMPANLTSADGKRPKWAAQTVEGTWGPNDDYKEPLKLLLLRWSNPDACKAWWDQYKGGVKWNQKLLKFELTAK